MAEPRIVQILRAHGEWMPKAELLDRYCQKGATRSTAYNAVSLALDNGWIMRRGKRGAYAFAMADDAPKVVGGFRCPRGRVRAESDSPAEPARPYVGPAFDRAQLAPSVGLVCDPEVMPPEVGRIIDSLHRHFDALFMGVE